MPASYSTTPNAPFGATIGSPFSASQGPSGGYGTSAPVARTQNYQDLINNDPGFRQLRADLSAQGISDAAGLRAGRQRGIIQFGEAPTYEGVDAGFLGAGYNTDIDEGTRALAASNTQAGMSTTARLAKARTDNIRAIKNALAARGGLRSGELGYQLGEQDLQYTTAQYDSRQRLLDYLSGISSAYARSEYDRQRQLAAGAGQAAQGAYSAPPQTPGATNFTPPSEPGSTWDPTPAVPGDPYSDPDIWGTGGAIRR